MSGAKIGYCHRLLNFYDPMLFLVPAADLTRAGHVPCLYA